MIYPQTMLTVADNTGARKIMCIRVLGGNRKYAKVGDMIIGVVKEALPNMPIKRSDVVRAVIVRTCKTIRRQDGMYIRFDDNAAVIVNLDNNPRGTRVFGPVAREIRDKNFSKIVSLAPEVLSPERNAFFCEQKIDTQGHPIPQYERGKSENERIVQSCSTYLRAFHMNAKMQTKCIFTPLTEKVSGGLSNATPVACAAAKKKGGKRPVLLRGHPYSRTVARATHRKPQATSGTSDVRKGSPSPNQNLENGNFWRQSPQNEKMSLKDRPMPRRSYCAK